MRKKLPYLTILLFLSLSLKIQAQLDIKLNATGLAQRQLDLAAEAGYDKLGLELNLGYSIKPYGSALAAGAGLPRQGILLGLKSNYYFKPKTSLDGFYVAPYVSFQSLNLDLTSVDEGKVKFTCMGAGLLLGFKYNFTDRFGSLFEAGAGYNFIYKYKNKETGNKVSLEESIPFFGGLTKLALPSRLSVVYRIGGG